jgi:hypothetical protein
MDFVGSRPYIVALRTPSLCQPPTVFAVLGRGPLNSAETEKRYTEMEGQAAHCCSLSAQNGTSSVVEGLLFNETKSPAPYSSSEGRIAGEFIVYLSDAGHTFCRALRT